MTDGEVGTSLRLCPECGSPRIDRFGRTQHRAGLTVRRRRCTDCGVISAYIVGAWLKGPIAEILVEALEELARLEAAA